MTLRNVAEENIQDAQERMDSLPKRSTEWIKQRRRRLENFIMLRGLDSPTNEVGRTRTRLKEQYFSPQSFITIPPKADD